MSMFDNKEKDELYDEIINFLDNHPVSELLHIVTVAVREEKE